MEGQTLRPLKGRCHPGGRGDAVARGGFSARLEEKEEEEERFLSAAGRHIRRSECGGKNRPASLGMMAGVVGRLMSELKLRPPNDRGACSG